MLCDYLNKNRIKTKEKDKICVFANPEDKVEGLRLRLRLKGEVDEEERGSDVGSWCQNEREGKKVEMLDAKPVENSALFRRPVVPAQTCAASSTWSHLRLFAITTISVVRPELIFILLRVQ